MTSEIKFKINDRVRCIKHSTKSMLDKTGIVVNPDEGGTVRVRLDKPFYWTIATSNGKQKKSKIQVKVYWFTPDQLAKVETATWGQEKI